MKNALSTVALSTLVALGSFGAHAAIEEGQLTIWINGDKGSITVWRKSVRSLKPTPESKLLSLILMRYKINSHKPQQQVMVLTLCFGLTTVLAVMRKLAY
ncbi:maltose-binding periplasmic protein [Vibrio cholerae]|nr:maltose-binding periplasmic protein [Vibrio cholerae]